jgi:DnaJ-class molecular chaperone
MVVWRGKTGSLAKGDLICPECRGTGGPLVIATGPLGDWIDQSCPRCGGQPLLKTARRQDYEDCPYCGGTGTLHWLGAVGVMLNIDCSYCVATGLVPKQRSW